MARGEVRIDPNLLRSRLSPYFDTTAKESKPLAGGWCATSPGTVCIRAASGCRFTAGRSRRVFTARGKLKKVTNLECLSAVLLTLFVKCKKQTSEPRP